VTAVSIERFGLAQIHEGDAPSLRAAFSRKLRWGGTISNAFKRRFEVQLPF
jgi:hypothetical protein